MSTNHPETIEIVVADTRINFDNARKSADEAANKKMKEPLLIAWYDGVAKTGHPDVQECHDKPGWITYAKSRGGTLTISVNNGKYILIYSETSLDDT